MDLWWPLSPLTRYTLALVVTTVLFSSYEVSHLFTHNHPAFDKRTASAREIWRQMQATRYHKANPKLKINTDVSGSAAAPEVVFKLIDDTEVRLLPCVKALENAKET